MYFAVPAPRPPPLSPLCFTHCDGLQQYSIVHCFECEYNVRGCKFRSNLTKMCAWVLHHPIVWCLTAADDALPGLRRAVEPSASKYDRKGWANRTPLPQTPSTRTNHHRIHELTK